MFHSGRSVFVTVISMRLFRTTVAGCERLGALWRGDRDSHDCATVVVKIFHFGRDECWSRFDRHRGVLLVICTLVWTSTPAPTLAAKWPSDLQPTSIRTDCKCQSRCHREKVRRDHSQSANVSPLSSSEMTGWVNVRGTFWRFHLQKQVRRLG